MYMQEQNNSRTISGSLMTSEMDHFELTATTLKKKLRNFYSAVGHEKMLRVDACLHVMPSASALSLTL